MSRAEDFAKHAEHAEGEARKSPNPLEKDSYRRIAQGWRELEMAARAAEKRAR